MAGTRDEDAAEGEAPFAEPEDSFGDIWGQVEGPSSEDEGESEAFTEFAASPGVYMRGASLRRPAPSADPAPSDVPAAAEPASPLPALEPGDVPGLDFDDGPEHGTPLGAEPKELPGVTGTADDVRSLLDKVMEEALPTNANAEAPPDPAFPGDNSPTLRPAPSADPVPADPAPAPSPVATAVLEPRYTPNQPPQPAPPRAPGPATQLVDPEAAAMEHAVGAAGSRPASFDALPAALSDEVKQANKVVRGQPAKTLHHLTDDLAIDVAQTSPRIPAGPHRATSGLVPPPQAAPPVVQTDSPLELAYDPHKPAAPAAPASVDASQLLDEVSPKSNGKVMIGLAIALIGLLLLLVLKSLL